MARRMVFLGMVLLVLRASVDAQDQARQDASQSDVIRSRLRGSIQHGRGGTEWRTVSGTVRVLSPTVLDFADGTRIELDIIAPAPDQMATATGTLYGCGAEATEHLRALIGDQKVTCFQNADGEGPWLAYAGDVNLEHAMIVGGWALADHSSLHAAEIIARENQRGLWRGEFIAFDDWRAGARLPGEPPPAALVNEREAAALLMNHAGASPIACDTLVARIVRDLPTIRSLNFPLGSQLSDEGLRQVASLSHLEALSLEHCAQITDAGLSHVKTLPRLRSLHVPPATTDAGLEHLAALSGLRHLEISYATITDAGLKPLAALKDLRRLMLYQLAIGDAGLSHLSELRELRRLTFYNVQITDKGLKHLRALRNLAALEFGRVPLSDAGVDSLLELPELRFLDLSDTGITDEGARRLAGLKHLRVLLLPSQVTHDAKQHLKAMLPDLRHEGRVEDVLTDFE